MKDSWFPKIKNFSFGTSSVCSSNSLSFQLLPHVFFSQVIMQIIDSGKTSISLTDENA